ncbi:flavodoxin family protein [Marinitoga litoralis]|uniref:flavodoxin family protein n=1 Tax=Marinitoga litoralis TaxID=570855 RepID=UPI0019608671|nr:flavodoxin family protein [Marinitoga litoralis]MBM7560232.1 multimeric flavodoxin WrbA [Marinitoga litoralis]
MKIVAINSSMRKGRTYELLTNIGKKLDYDFEIINIKDYKINYCLGCEVCIKKDYCVINDDVEKLKEKLINADGIIISTPVYIENISGTLKTFFDRNCKWVHRSELIGKPVLLVSTTAGSGLKDVLDYLESVVISWGMKPCGKIGRKIQEKKDVSSEELQLFIDSIEGRAKKEKISLSRLIRFQVQKAMSTNLLDLDKNFWKKNGLINKSYFYEENTKINPISKFISNEFGIFLSKKIQENARKVKLQGGEKIEQNI